MEWDPSYVFFISPKIRLTQPGVFNDPFEGQQSSDSLIKILEEHNSNGQLNKQIADARTHGANQIYVNIGVLCLTTKPDNLLMWSHYAKNHEGIVVEFDITHPFFNQKIEKENSEEICSYRGRPLKVQYRTDRYEAKWKHDYTHDPLLVKSAEWSYEDEYRMFLDIDSAENQPIKTDNSDPNNERSIVLFNIPPECIKKVFIGCRASEKNSRGSTNKQEIIDQLNSAMETGLYQDVEVFDVVKHSNRFKLEFLAVKKEAR